MKKTLALVLAMLMLLGLMAGCANEPAATTTPDTPATTPDTPVTDEPAEEPVEAPADEPAEEPADNLVEEPADEPAETPEEPAVEAPVSPIPFAEPKTFSIWITNTGLPKNVVDYNETAVWQEIQRRTNVSIDWEIASATEQFSLMLTSGEYTDVFAQPALTGGYDYSIDEEIIIDLSELVPTYAPNFYAMLCADEPSRKDIYTDSGNLPGLKMVNKSYEPTFLGYYVRQDWLDEAGITGTLQTFADWENALKVRKNDFDRPNALFLDSGTAQSEYMLAGFNSSTGFLAFDGEVVFAPMEQNYYDYLDLLTKWYADGYVDVDFATNSSFFRLTAEFSTEKFGIFRSFASNYDKITEGGLESNPNFKLTPIDVPTNNPGEPRMVRVTGDAATQLGGTYVCISGQCEEPEAVLQFFDYFYTDEGYVLANYGIEGESYELVDGKPVWTEYITNNPDGELESEMRAHYSVVSWLPQKYDWARGQQGMSEGTSQAQATWMTRYDPFNCASMNPGFSLTTEESEDCTSRLQDINTLVSEYSAKVIIGELDLASTWDAHVADIISMDIETCLEAYQAAYDRYQAR